MVRPLCVVAATGQAMAVSGQFGMVTNRKEGVVQLRILARNVIGTPPLSTKGHATQATRLSLAARRAAAS